MAREEYLLHAGEDTIHDPSLIKSEMDPKKKRENFWYYHKWHVIIIAAVLVMAVWTIHDIVNRVNPDYTIGLLTTKSYSSETIAKLEEQIAVKGKDLNGDGKVVVTVNAYNVASIDDQSADVNMQQAAITKLAADFQTADSMIFLVDDENLKRYTDQSPIFSYPDGSAPADGATDYENMGTKWSKIPYLANMDLNVQEATLTGNGTTHDMQPAFKDLNVCIRVFKGTWLEQKQDKAEYYNQCKELLDSFQSIN